MKNFLILFVTLLAFVGVCSFAVSDSVETNDRYILTQQEAQQAPAPMPEMTDTQKQAYSKIVFLENFKMEIQETLDSLNNVLSPEYTDTAQAKNTGINKDITEAYFLATKRTQEAAQFEIKQDTNRTAKIKDSKGLKALLSRIEP
jgi:hypothetical protein